jgi:hypothetical protein
MPGPDVHRTRIVSFRLSEEEYDRLLEICASAGMRGVSEMARAGIQLILRDALRAPEAALETRVSDLEVRLRQLSLELKRISQQLPPENG